MLRWSLTFLVLALIAALFAFTSMAIDASPIAEFLFFLFLSLFVLSLLAGIRR